MKKSFYYVMMAVLLTGAASCTKDFLQKPSTTGNTTIETVFSTRTQAEAAIAGAYRAVLAMNMWDGRSINNGTISGVSGEMAYGESWGSLKKMVDAGYSANASGETNNATSTDNFFDNFAAIRKAYIVKENIDNVTDMDASIKTNVKGEMTALIAYRYMGLFQRYGGVPLVSKALEGEDNLNIPRATLQRTLDTVIKLSDEAIAALPDKWPDTYYGRLTKGFAMATKARALIFAARPLFNSASPVVSLGANNNLICFGSADAKRWQDAITASEAVITWAKSNGYAIINTGGGVGVPNPNAFDDYGNATSTPANKEVLQAYKFDDAFNKFFEFYNPTTRTYNPQGNNERYLIDHYGMLSNFLTNYYRADGTSQSWPGQGVASALPYADYAAKMQAMEPRFKADNYAHGIDPWNNIGSTAWTYANCGKGENHNGTYGRGVGQSTKFYFKAGNRGWFEFPLFRMSEFYLNLAEAYNEAGNSNKALVNLNVVHNRAGLPSVTENSQAALRTIIQREWAVEFYNESRRLFDVRHWKLADIANGIVGGPMREFQFTLVAGQSNDLLPQNLLNYYDQVTYTAYWNNKMFLDPIPQAEIDKGVLIQNPGY